jgi:predicted secreted protein
MKAQTINHLEGKMKSIIFFGLVCILLLPLIMTGCGAGTKTTIDLTLDDFATQNNIVKNITVSPHGIITITLGSNGSTGYQWSDAIIDNADKLEQTSHNYIEPQTSLAGAAGKETFTFMAKVAGTATIKLSYFRPWDSTNSTYTVTINVTIKVGFPL